MPCLPLPLLLLLLLLQLQLQLLLLLLPNNTDSQAECAVEHLLFAGLDRYDYPATPFM